jgi:hypothetical protein
MNLLLVTSEKNIYNNIYRFSHKIAEVFIISKIDTKTVVEIYIKKIVCKYEILTNYY